MDTQIKNFLESHEEFSSIKEGIFNDVIKKGYCIVQLLTDDEIATQLTNSKISDNYQIEKYCSYQEDSSVIIFENSIFYNFKLYHNINIFEKKRIQNTAIVQTLFKNKSYGNIYRNNNNYINIIKYAINNFFQTYKKNIVSIKYITSFLFYGLGLNLLLTIITSQEAIIEKWSIYILSGTFIIAIFILFGFFIIEILNNILKTQKYNSIIERILWYDTRFSGLKLYKNIDDNILELEKLDIRKINMYENLDYGILKIETKKIQKASQILSNIHKNVNFLNKKNSFSGIEKSLIFSAKNLGILVENWKNLLEKFSSEIINLNNQARSENQKLFVKTTSKLNDDIGVAIKQLEILKF